MSETAPTLHDFMTGGPAAAPADSRVNLMGMDREDLAEALAPLDVKPFRAKQVFQWIYNRGVTDFDAMTNLSKGLRAELAERFRIERLGVNTEQRSTDGTRKWLVPVRRRPGSGNRPYPGDGPRYALRLQPGRLHPDLYLLPHRHAETGAEFGGAGNRRPNHAGA